MPQLGETVTEGTITKWHKSVGDEVVEDEVLFEVSTDKVDSEVASPVSGTVDEILVQEGETVSVGTKLAVIGQGGAARASGPGADQAGQTARNRSGSLAVGLAEGQAGAAAVTAQALAAAAEATAQAPDEHDIPIGAGAEQGSSSRRQGGQAAQAKPPTGAPPRPGSRPADQRPPSAPAQGGPSKLLSPVVRRLIAEHGLDPAEIVGSGAVECRITRDDVLAADRRQRPETGPSPPWRGSSPTTPRGRGRSPSRTDGPGT